MTPLLMRLAEVMKPITEDCTFHHIPGPLHYQSTVRVITPGLTLPPEVRDTLEETVLHTVPAAYSVKLEYLDRHP